MIRKEFDILSKPVKQSLLSRRSEMEAKLEKFNCMKLQVLLDVN
jgi:hypothetical protein